MPANLVRETLAIDQRSVDCLSTNLNFSQKTEITQTHSRLYVQLRRLIILSARVVCINSCRRYHFLHVYVKIYEPFLAL